jgi:thiosulfate/3-mercaptopyruvate sulfurtransferase
MLMNGSTGAPPTRRASAGAVMSKIDLVTPAWLFERLGDPSIVILDGSYYLPNAGRDADAEYRAAHIPGAIRFDIDVVKDRSSPLPHMLPEADEFAAAVGAMGISDEHMVVAYDGAGIFASPRVAWTFRTFGSRRVAVLDGGLPAWRAAGYPVESGEPEPREAAEFLPKFHDEAVANLSDIREALESGSAQVLDARSAARFSAEEPEPRPGMRSGHMPGAINLHYGALLKEGRMADSDTIEEAMRMAGVDPTQPIVTTCGSGVTAAILLLAIEQTGRPAPALYDGSWAEWGSRDDTEVVTGA